MLDTELLAEAIRDMLAAGFLRAALAGEAIRELATVIGQQFHDLDGTCFRHFAQEIDMTTGEPGSIFKAGL